MLKEVRFTVSSPICGCSKKDITWNVPTIEGGPGLSLKCNICKTELRVSNSQFRATIVFEVPYPDDRPKSKETGAPTNLDAKIAIN